MPTKTATRRRVPRHAVTLDEGAAMVIATGGFAHSVASHSDTIDRVDSLLTLKGLMLLGERNG